MRDRNADMTSSPDSSPSWQEQSICLSAPMSYAVPPAEILKHMLSPCAGHQLQINADTLTACQSHVSWLQRACCADVGPIIHLKTLTLSAQCLSKLHPLVVQR